MISLKEYLLKNSRIDSVCMIRLVYNGGYWDYTIWSLHQSYWFFFDENMKVSHLLFLDQKIKEIDENHILYSPDKYQIGIELFYGGAIL